MLNKSDDNVWNRIAHRYDRLWVQKVSLAATRTAILGYFESLDTEECRTVLDLGCGTGQLLEELAGRYPGFRLTGVDKSCEMIRVAQARDTGARLLCLDVSMDILDSVIPAGSIDVIICCHSFPYYTDKPGVLGKLRRALKKDGTMIFVQASVNSRYDAFVMALIERTAEKADYLSKQEFRKLVSADFEITDEFDIKEKIFMPSICGFVMRKRG
ncbi:MAG: class I SAM-dependent DNA methyltransferase [Saccharofermentanales bacterium]